MPANNAAILGAGTVGMAVDSGAVVLFARGGVGSGGVQWWSGVGTLKEAVGVASAGRQYGWSVGVDGVWPDYVVVGGAPAFSVALLAAHDLADVEDLAGEGARHPRACPAARQLDHTVAVQ